MYLLHFVLKVTVLKARDLLFLKEGVAGDPGITIFPLLFANF